MPGAGPAPGAPSFLAGQIVERVDAVDDVAIDALVAEYEETYDVVPELRAGGDRHDSLRYGAAQEIAMRSFLEEVGATAFDIPVLTVTGVL